GDFKLQQTSDSFRRADTLPPFQPHRIPVVSPRTIILQRPTKMTDSFFQLNICQQRSTKTLPKIFRARCGLVFMGARIKDLSVGLRFAFLATFSLHSANGTDVAWTVITRCRSSQTPVLRGFAQKILGGHRPPLQL